MSVILEQYIKEIIDSGYTIEKYKAVSNPCVNFAITLADKLLDEAYLDGYVNFFDLSIEIEGKWQFLSKGSETIGYNQLIEEIEKHIVSSLERYLGVCV